MAPRSLAQLIGAAPHVSTNYILALALFAAVALTASQFHLSFSPDPNPQQVHLTHSLTQGKMLPAEPERSRSSRGRETALSRECVGQRKGEREREREGHASLALRSHLGGHLLSRILSRHNIWIAVAVVAAVRPFVAFTGRPGRPRKRGPLTFDEAEKCSATSPVG